MFFYGAQKKELTMKYGRFCLKGGQEGAYLIFLLTLRRKVWLYII